MLDIGTHDKPQYKWWTICLSYPYLDNHPFYHSLTNPVYI